MKIRFPVVVADDESWSVAGGSRRSDYLGSKEALDERATDWAIDGLESNSSTLAVHWITVDVPVPVSAELEGEVEA